MGITFLGIDIMIQFIIRAIQNHNLMNQSKPNTQTLSIARSSSFWRLTKPRPMGMTIDLHAGAMFGES